MFELWFIRNITTSMRAFDVDGNKLVLGSMNDQNLSVQIVDGQVVGPADSLELRRVREIERHFPNLEHPIRGVRRSRTRPHPGQGCSIDERAANDDANSRLANIFEERPSIHGWLPVKAND
jgi:hypothetical protein